MIQIAVTQTFLEKVILAVNLVVDPQKRRSLRTKIKGKEKKEAVKVQNKDTHQKAEKAKHKVCTKTKDPK